MELSEQAQALTDRLNAIDALTEAARTVTLSAQGPFDEPADQAELAQEAMWDIQGDECPDHNVHGTHTDEELDSVLQRLAKSSYLERRRLVRSIAEAWSNDDVYRLAVRLYQEDTLYGSETGPALARQLMRRAGVRFFEIGTEPGALMRQRAAFRSIRLDLQKALPAPPQPADFGDYNIFAFGNGTQI
ncbi:hypothetical protein ABT272_42820 [Streptomyces sp900105245]|uniref:Uncharacterized protein n=1 Tax=Streptomyces sp. 900105245 TaxID=3154379 RepID=A0ABV1UKR9_9ACTN